MFNSIRLRLTLWYLLLLGSVLIAFSTYIYSSLSDDERKEFDTSLLRTGQAMASYFSEFAEKNNVIRGAQETVRELKFGKMSAAIFREGQLLTSNEEGAASTIASLNLLATATASRRPAFAAEGKTNKRIVAVPFQVDRVNYAVVVIEPMDELAGQLARVRKIILFALPGALVLAGFGGFLLARKSLEPVVSISQQAEHISAKNLHERLNITTQDELGRLAGVFNALLSRLDASFRVMREFMADASHELRTPLAIIHGEADVSLSRERSASEYRESLGIMRENCKRMARIVSDMLVLARADCGEQPLRPEELYLNDLVEGCCRSAQALAVLKGVQLACDAGEDISFHGDEELLKRMTVNLVDNAIRYTPSGGSISVRLIKEDSCACLTVSDTGVGIPPDCTGRVFDRFFRVDKSRSRVEGGSGLGLSIVKLAAESHRGSVDLESEPGRGSTFTVRLPR
jgi:two-component system, OmpR family, sensor kinase